MTRPGGFVRSDLLPVRIIWRQIVQMNSKQNNIPEEGQWASNLRSLVKNILCHPPVPPASRVLVLLATIEVIQLLAARETHESRKGHRYSLVGFCGPSRVKEEDRAFPDQDPACFGGNGTES